MREKILVVEDEPSIAENISYALSTEGFAPVLCSSARDARQELPNAALVILDVGLPDENGFDLLKEIRAGSGIPVVIVTARSLEADRVLGLELGADDYVVKPFSPRELTARVRAVLRRSAAGTPGADPAAGPFLVDEARRTVFYHGKPLDLTRQEYRLLQVLVRRPGRVYTRNELLDLVWDGSGMSGDRTVDAHVKSIRKKLTIIRPEEEAIITHRGWGYSIKDPGV